LRNHAQVLEQSISDGTREISSLQAELEKERTRAADLQRALHAELEKERTRAADLQRALHAEQAEKFQAKQRNDELEEELAKPAVVLALRRLRQRGDRITGGGLRSFTKRTFQQTLRWAMQQPRILAAVRKILRPFPNLTTTLYNVATKGQEVLAPLPPKSPSADESAVADALPASARKIYRGLRSLILEAEATDRAK
jgi:hypothetical protein